MKKYFYNLLAIRKKLALLFIFDEYLNLSMTYYFSTLARQEYKKMRARFER